MDHAAETKMYKEILSGMKAGMSKKDYKYLGDGFIVREVLKGEKNITHEDEAKLLVALAFRNGPLEDIHADKKVGEKIIDGRITDDEMKELMKCAVDRVNMFLWLRDEKPIEYVGFLDYLTFWCSDVKNWDKPRDPILVAKEVTGQDKKEALI